MKSTQSILIAKITETKYCELSLFIRYESGNCTVKMSYQFKFSAYLLQYTVKTTKNSRYLTFWQWHPGHNILEWFEIPTRYFWNQSCYTDQPKIWEKMPNAVSAAIRIGHMIFFAWFRGLVSYYIYFLLKIA